MTSKRQSSIRGLPELIQSHEWRPALESIDVKGSIH